MTRVVSGETVCPNCGSGNYTPWVHQGKNFCNVCGASWDPTESA